PRRSRQCHQLKRRPRRLDGGHLANSRELTGVAQDRYTADARSDLLEQLERRPQTRQSIHLAMERSNLCPYPQPPERELRLALPRSPLGLVDRPPLRPPPLPDFARGVS